MSQPTADGGRILPQDPAAERAVLSAAMTLGARGWAECADLLSPTSFSVDSNSHAWACLHKIYSEGRESAVDLPTVLASAGELGLSSFFAKDSELRHLKALLDSHKAMPVSLESVRRLAGRVKKLELARGLCVRLELAREAMAGLKGDEPVDRILSLAEGPVLELLPSFCAGGEVVDLRQEALAYVEHVIAHPREGGVGVPTGFPLHDEAIGGGVRPGGVALVGARTKAGKSQMAAASAYNACLRGYPTFYADTEMSRGEQLDRLLANLACVPVKEVERGKFSDPSFPDKLREAARLLEQLPAPLCYSQVAGLANEEILSRVRRWLMQTVGLNGQGKARPCLFVYDYLKLMTAEKLGRGVQEHQLVGYMAQGLKDFAARWELPCLAFSQLNRDGINREDSAALSQSDRVAWFCTSFCILKKKAEEEIAEDPSHSHKLVYVFSRHGEGLPEGDFINMKAEYRFGRLTEGPLRSEVLGRIPPPPEGQPERPRARQRRAPEQPLRHANNNQRPPGPVPPRVPF